SGRIDEALAIMSSHRPADFPPHWDPPPRVVFDPDPEMIVAVMEKVIDRPSAGWVREVYFQKFSQALFDFRSLAMFREERFVNSTWPRTERLLSRMAKSGSLSAENVESVETIRAYLEGRAPSPATTAPRLPRDPASSFPPRRRLPISQNFSFWHTDFFGFVSFIGNLLEPPRVSQLGIPSVESRGVRHTLFRQEAS
ncbi:MAG TPA: hypothetical protein VN541_08570, partial [Tepidisphaeraceae bacterium]|nr:hypothetical protein [Tepidisphaeraceae bacterium]